MSEREEPEFVDGPTEQDFIDALEAIFTMSGMLDLRADLSRVKGSGISSPNEGLDTYMRQPDNLTPEEIAFADPDVVASMEGVKDSIATAMRAVAEVRVADRAFMQTIRNVIARERLSLQRARTVDSPAEIFGPFRPDSDSDRLEEN